MKESKKEGKENRIIMINYITVILQCKFNLTLYPFDIQKCPIQLAVADYQYLFKSFTCSCVSHAQMIVWSLDSAPSYFSFVVGDTELSLRYVHYGTRFYVKKK